MLQEAVKQIGATSHNIPKIQVMATEEEIKVSLGALALAFLKTPSLLRCSTRPKLP